MTSRPCHPLPLLLAALLAAAPSGAAANPPHAGAELAPVLTRQLDSPDRAERDEAAGLLAAMLRTAGQPLERNVDALLGAGLPSRLEQVPRSPRIDALRRRWAEALGLPAATRAPTIRPDLPIAEISLDERPDSVHWVRLLGGAPRLATLQRFSCIAGVMGFATTADGLPGPRLPAAALKQGDAARGDGGALLFPVDGGKDLLLRVTTEQGCAAPGAFSLRLSPIGILQQAPMPSELTPGVEHLVHLEAGEAIQLRLEAARNHVYTIDAELVGEGAAPVLRALDEDRAYADDDRDPERGDGEPVRLDGIVGSGSGRLVELRNRSSAVAGYLRLRVRAANLGELAMGSSETVMLEPARTTWRRLALHAGRRYAISSAAVDGDVDTRLMLQDLPTGQVLAENDDDGESLDSRISILAGVAREVLVGVTEVGDGRGRARLQVEEIGKVTGVSLEGGPDERRATSLPGDPRAGLFLTAPPGHAAGSAWFRLPMQRGSVYRIAAPPGTLAVGSRAAPAYPLSREPLKADRSIEVTCWTVAATAEVPVTLRPQPLGTAVTIERVDVADGACGHLDAQLLQARLVDPARDDAGLAAAQLAHRVLPIAATAPRQQRVSLPLPADETVEIMIRAFAVTESTGGERSPMMAVEGLACETEDCEFAGTTEWSWFGRTGKEPVALNLALPRGYTAMLEVTVTVRQPYDGIEPGDHVTVGRHVAVAGDDNWASSMDKYVGKTARVVRIRGRDAQGCWLVALDVDGGRYAWRTRSLRRAQEPSGTGGKVRAPMI
jgi:hypothetical protein